MPDGKTHHKIWKTGWIIVIPASLYVLSIDTGIGIGIAMGYLWGAYITPDWDLTGTTRDEGRMMRQLPIIGIVLYGISSAYGAIFRHKHRSFITHFPYISTAIRLIFIFWWLTVLYHYGIISYQEWHLHLAIGIFIGLGFSDALHYAADMLIKTKRKSRRKK